MRIHAGYLRLAFLIVLAASIAGFGQQRVGPIHPEKPEPELLRRIPQSGYDPFHWNRYTGQWDYVPIPYEPEPPGANYNPFRFNWHSGRFDYVPHPLPQDYREQQRQRAESARHVDTRLDLQQLTPRAIPAPPADPAPEIKTRQPPPPLNRHLAPPTTAPTTARVTPQEDRALALRMLRDSGRWEYDYIKGRWVFVLPGDD